MTVVDIAEAAQRLSELVDRVELGEVFLIAENGTPLVTFTAVEQQDS